MTPVTDDSALGDVRILDIAGEIGLYCTKLLADLGADVIKVEPPGGHPARAVGPFLHDRPDPEKSLYFWSLSTSQRSVTLDVTRPEGCDLLRRLAATADVVVDSFPPGHLDSLSLGYRDLTDIRPDIILTSITGFGQTGPHARYKAPDIVGVAMSGVMWLAGDADDPPNRPYGNQGYISASLQAAGGTLMALYHREVTGEGQHVDVSMQEAMSIAQETAMQAWDMTRVLRRRIGAWRIPNLPIPGVGCYECADGYVYCYLGTPGGAPWTEMLRWMGDEGRAEDLGEEPYASLIEELGLPLVTQVAADPPALEKTAPIMTHIDDVLRRFLAAKPKVQVYEQAQARRLLIGIVSTPKDLAEDRQLVFRRWLREVDHPELGEPLRYPGPPVRLSETPSRIRRRPPLLGEHNAEIFGEIGLAPADLGALKDAGVI